LEWIAPEADTGFYAGCGVLFVLNVSPTLAPILVRRGLCLGLGFRILLPLILIHIVLLICVFVCVGCAHVWLYCVALYCVPVNDRERYSINGRVKVESFFLLEDGARLFLYRLRLCFFL